VGIAATGSGDAVGKVDAQGPTADVHFVGAVVERFAGAPDPEPMPVVGLNVVPIGTARRGTLPEIPVESGWDRCIFAVADGFAGVVVPGFRKIGPTDQSVMDLLDNFDGVGRGSLLRAHLDELAVFLLRTDEKRAFGGIVAAGFFDVDMLARLQSEDGQGCMPVIGRGDGDGVNIFEGENLAEVLFTF